MGPRGCFGALFLPPFRFGAWGLCEFLVKGRRMFSCFLVPVLPNYATEFKNNSHQKGPTCQISLLGNGAFGR